MIGRSTVRRWRTMPFSAKIKTTGYGISILSVFLLGAVSWQTASKSPLLAACLLVGATTSIIGMSFRWWSYEIEEAEKET
jgi:hypothetical protein